MLQGGGTAGQPGSRAGGLGRCRNVLLKAMGAGFPLSESRTSSSLSMG